MVLNIKKSMLMATVSLFGTLSASTYMVTYNDLGQYANVSNEYWDTTSRAEIPISRSSVTASFLGYATDSAQSNAILLRTTKFHPFVVIIR